MEIERDTGTTRADEISRNASFRYFLLRVRSYSHVRPRLFITKHFFILPPAPWILRFCSRRATIGLVGVWLYGFYPAPRAGIAHHKQASRYIFRELLLAGK